MKKGIIYAILTFLILTSLILASCNNKSTTASTTTSTTASIATTTTTTTAKSTTSSTTTATTTSVTTSASSTGHWWDSLGTPEYGGVIVDRITQNITTWDPYQSTNGQGGFTPYMQQLWCRDYTVDPNIWDFTIGWLPSKYATNLMMTGYDMPNPYTVVCHLRTDVYWQNIAPANGHEPLDRRQTGSAG